LTLLLIGERWRYRSRPTRPSTRNWR